jgi:gliding motility-associated-like protein
MKHIKAFLASVLFISGVLKAQVPATWTVNTAAYQYQMTLTAKANQACVDLVDPNNYIAAFVGNQCRGVVKTNTSVGPNQLGLLTVKSNSVSGEQVVFKIYNASTNAVVKVLDSVLFNQGSSFGTLANPFMMYTNHVPTDMAISNYTVTENFPLSSGIAIISTVDQDPGTIFNYSLTAGQAENTEFAISGSQLVVNANFDYETDSTKVIELQVDDNGGCTYVETFTIHVINANDAPTALTLTTTAIYDHQQAGTYVGQFFTTDPDLNDAHTYSLVVGAGSTDNAQFYVQHDTLYNVNLIDYNTQSVFYIRARSTDAGGLFIENTFTLNVSNVNDAPSDIILSSYLMAENTPSATAIGTLSVVDLDLADTHTLTLVAGAGSTDNALVAIVGNTLQTNASYNFESQDSLFIRIQAADPFNATYTKTFVIVVTDLNETPTNLSLSDTTILEGLAVGTVVGNMTTIDEDFNATHTYSLVSGTGDTDNALFAINSNSLVSAATYSFVGQTYSVRLRTTDVGGLFYERPFTIVLRDSNYVPTDIIPSMTSFDENIAIGTPVSTLTTIDYDSQDTHTLTLVSGAGSTDNIRFKIVGNVLQTDSTVNYEKQNVFYVRIKSTDPGNASVTKTFTFTANDLNDTPTDITLSGDSVYELLPTATTIGTFTTTDEDAGATHTYALVSGTGDTDNALFAITNNTLVSNATYTFTGQTYSIRVQSTDNGGLMVEKIFSIKVLNVNEAPTDIIIDTTSIFEDNDLLFYVSQIRAVDTDQPDYFIYSLVSGSGSEDNAEFTISGSSLYINQKTDFEVKDVYYIRVKTEDFAGLSFEKSFEITIKDVIGNTIPLPASNYISPNGDRKNDFWEIDNVEIYKEFGLKVFDQFGQVIYSVPNNYNNEFDGKLNGEPLPTGNYYYELKKGKKIFKGNITIVN